MNGSIKPPRKLTYVADDEAAGSRLDAWLSRQDTEFSRSRLTALIKDGAVANRDRVIREPSHTVKSGEQFDLYLPEVRPSTVAAEPIPLDILYEDEAVIVVIKPAGMVVHPAAGHAGGTLVNALLHHCGASLSGIGGVMRPGIVHRLDQQVSGVMVAAKTDAAHRHLSGQFSIHSVDRVYHALVHGLPNVVQGTISAPIGRHPKDRLRQAVVEKGGKRAVTHYQVTQSIGTRFARIDVRLETGRTHQIRVHLSHLGHPIAGDRLYRLQRYTLSQEPAGMIAAEKRIMLHARRLGFEHPVSGETMVFEAPEPKIFADLYAELV